MHTLPTHVRHRERKLTGRDAARGLHTTKGSHHASLVSRSAQMVLRSRRLETASTADASAKPLRAHPMRGPMRPVDEWRNSMAAHAMTVHDVRDR
jgi:hypothetical protein